MTRTFSPSTLAEELSAEWLLMDETAGRAEAKRSGLQTVGTLGILRLAHRAKLLNFHTALDRLIQSGFHASPPLIEAILDSIKEV